MLRTRLLRKFADLYDQTVIDKLIKGNYDEIDGRALYGFSLKELKKRVSPDVWATITANDPIFKIPELQDVCDIEDSLPHFHHSLPPHLSRPALLLDERQRAAKRMTLEYIKTEKAMVEERSKRINEFPILTTDTYELQAGLMVVRDPIWVLHDDVEVDWFKTRYKVLNDTGRVANLKIKDYEHDRAEDSIENDRNVRMRILERMMDNKEDLKYTPLKDSVHFLEADPNEKDPHSIAYAGGYRVWLLLKEKATGKWVFPIMRMVGNQSFAEVRRKIMKEIFDNKLNVHLLGPSPVKVDIVNHKEPVPVQRPRQVYEDIYDLYFNRSKLLFPQAKDQDIEKYLMKRYSISRHVESNTKEVKGKKSFYWRALYDNGSISLKPESPYNDWAWVPKLEMNRYLDEENYYRFIKVMTRT